MAPSLYKGPKFETICNKTIGRVTTHLENLEKSGNWKVVREKSGKLDKVRESYNHHLAGARVAKILPHFIISSFTSLIFSNQHS